MIGASYKHRDGGWTVEIHGGPEDIKPFEDLMQWVLGHEVDLRTGEMSEETKRYLNMRKILDEVPDVGAALDEVAKKTQLPKSVILSKAMIIYDAAFTATKAGDRLVIIKENGEQIELSPGFI